MISGDLNKKLLDNYLKIFYNDDKSKRGAGNVPLGHQDFRVKVNWSTGEMTPVPPL